MILLPPIKIARGEPFAYEATVQGQNWTGYVGSVVFRRNWLVLRRHADFVTMNETADPFLTIPATGTSAGLMQFSLTAAQALLFPALPRVGYFSTARFEISMASGADVQKFQGRASVAETLA